MHSTRRALSLDLFRALALGLVMMRHLVPAPAASGAWLQAVTSTLQRGGWVGVDLFFVLSGFLVGGLLFQEARIAGRIGFGIFLGRRAFKIYPLLWVSMGIVWWARRAYGLPVATGPLFADLFFYASYVRGLLGVGWSLAVEEHFYLLLPALLWWLGRKPVAEGSAPFAALPKVLALVVGASLLLRAISFGSEASFEFCAQFTCTHLRLDGLFFGVWLAYRFHFHRDEFLAWVQPNRAGLLLAGAAGLIPPFCLPIGSWYLLVPGFTVQYLAAGALLAAAVTWQPRESWLVRLGAAMGRQSYATYLVHYTIGTVGMGLLLRATGWTPAWAVCAGLYVTLSLGAGWLLTALVERPALALRNRIFPAWRPTITALPEPVGRPLWESIAA